MNKIGFGTKISAGSLCGETCTGVISVLSVISMLGEAMLPAEGAVGENLYLYNYNKLLYKYKIYFTCIGMADAARGEGGLSLKLLK